MKVFALGVLLVSLYCIEGAVVKRQAEGEGQAPEAQNPAESFISQYFPALGEYFKKETFTNYAAQTQALYQQLHERLLSEETTQRIGLAFSALIDSAKKAIQ